MSPMHQDMSRYRQQAIVIFAFDPFHSLRPAFTAILATMEITIFVPHAIMHWFIQERSVQKTALKAGEGVSAGTG